MLLFPYLLPKKNQRVLQKQQIYSTQINQKIIFQLFYISLIFYQLIHQSFLQNYFPRKSTIQAKSQSLIMQIDRHNISQHYKTIWNDINKSSFVSFDCQFTGLVTNLQKIEGKFSDHREFYERIKETALNFKILQFGLTAFIFNQNKKGYQPTSYNFYTLPYVNLSGFNNIMVSEVESLTFLSEHGIDWNRVFKSGIIPQRLIKPFQYHHHQYDKYQPPFQNQYFFSAADKQVINKIQTSLSQIQEKRSEELLDFIKQSIYNYFLSKYLNKLNLRKGKKTIKRFQFFVKTLGGLNKDSDDDIIFQKSEKQKPVKYVEKKEQTKMDEQKQIKQNQHSNQKKSIENLLKVIIDKKIPIVGHFPNLDLGLIYHTYIDDLPEHFQDFCQKTNQLFPFIYDTKILSRRVADHFKGMKVNLKSLYTACQDKRYLQPYCNVIQDKLSKQSQNRHQAGYDSYLTGIAFVGMANFIVKNSKRDAINFKQLQEVNNLIYSRETGEVSLRYPFYPRSLEYQRKIVILSQSKATGKWKQIAQKLSNYGTLYATEDHGETYFVFEQQSGKIQEIIKSVGAQYSLKDYNNRKYPKARDTYKMSQKQLYQNDK